MVAKLGLLGPVVWKGGGSVLWWHCLACLVILRESYAGVMVSLHDDGCVLVVSILPPLHDGRFGANLR